MIVEALLWLPTKVLGHFFQPATAMFDSIAANAEEAIRSYEEENNRT